MIMNGNFETTWKKVVVMYFMVDLLSYLINLISIRKSILNVKQEF